MRLIFFCGLWRTVHAHVRRDGPAGRSSRRWGGIWRLLSACRYGQGALWEKAAVDGSLQYVFRFVYDWVSVVYSFLFAPTFISLSVFLPFFRMILAVVVKRRSTWQSRCIIRCVVGVDVMRYAYHLAHVLRAQAACSQVSSPVSSWSVWTWT